MSDDDKIKELRLKDKVKLGMQCKVFYKFEQTSENGAMKKLPLNGWLESICDQIHWVANVDYAIVGFSCIEDLNIKERIYYRIPKENIEYDGRTFLNDPLKKEQ